jgi:hypothetical protein
MSICKECEEKDRTIKALHDLYEKTAASCFKLHGRDAGPSTRASVPRPDPLPVHRPLRRLLPGSER